MKNLRLFRTRGIALVIVLSLVVLLSALIVGFFSSVQNESVSSAAYKGSVTTKQLVSTANSLAMGQIADATHSFKDPGNPQVSPTSRLLWASQPGMIRTWDATGKGWKIFKLYSARDMVAEFDSNNHYSVQAALANEVPNDWPRQTALFVDLNQPVVVPDDSGGIERVGEKQHYRASYPILDPLAMVPTGLNGAPPFGVDGFSLKDVPGYPAPGPVVLKDDKLDPTLPVPGKTSNPAPMPVRWIYVLQDGTLTVPTGMRDDGTTATWDTASTELTPSRANPIVGRIAFWTDDESCKLNVNTASEPTPWDTPRGVTIQDLKYGQFQPSNKEYQRYPGHPFSTALSPVLFPGYPLQPLDKERLYTLIPRVPTGGTMSATQSGVAVTMDEDRLFATVDEFLFRPPSALGLPRPEATTVAPLVDMKRLRRARFFLTANSRAPELNMYGQPRVSLWPVWGNTNPKTAFDSLAAFCSSTGSLTPINTVKQYYFQRTDCNSPHTDYDNIQRNQQLYKYLQRLTSTPVPGYGGTFEQKWGDDRDQVLTEIFDYIRCVNLHDTQAGSMPYTPAGSGTVGAGQVAPIVIGSTKGFGRFHTIEQFGFHFICSQQEDKGVLTTATPGFKLGPNERMIEAAFLLEPFSPSLGWFWLKENMYFDVSFTSSFTVDGQDLKMRSGGRALSNTIGSGWHNNGRERGGTGGLRGPVQAFGGSGYQYVSTANPRVKVGMGGKTTMSFSGGTIVVKVYAGNSPNAANLVQTFTVNFPPGDLPLPDLCTTGTEAYRGTSATDAQYWWTFATRYSAAGDTPHAPGAEFANPARRFADETEGKSGFKKGGLFRREDVVRSIVPPHGDLRFIAAKSTISGTDFGPVVDGNIWSSPYRFAHIFSNSSGTHFLFGFCNEPGTSPVTTFPNDIPPGGVNSQLIASPNIAYHYARMPQIRPGAGAKYNLWNDFDNGSAQWPDGAYINKPDEGNQSQTNGVGGSPYTYFAWNFTEPTETYFSPNRLVPSAGMLGSLPTGVKRNRPWETLLFRPETRIINGTRHPGGDPAKGPKDHLLMDLFWMPFCEPYAISEPFSTAGKINLNYEIAPFSYITRSTGLYGAFKSEEPLLIPNAASKVLKLWDHETNDNPNMPDSSLDTDKQVAADWGKLARGQAPFDKLRRPIDMVETLKQADQRFTSGEIFRSATEVCELHLVRQGEKLTDYQKSTFMDDYLPTGDNTRERPYTNLYAKLTTRSNTYTVHSRVQVLRGGGARDEDFKVFHEDPNRIVSENRGSSIVERYIDPADPNLPDFANSQATNLCADEAFHFRVIATKRFLPEPSKLEIAK